MKTYEELVAEAVALPLNADAAPVDGRLVESDPPWSYGQRADELTSGATGPVLDLTGGDGESGAHPEALPYFDDEYAVVLNRHGRYAPTEVSRVLRPGGVFFTEQIGGLDGLAINEALGAPYPEDAAEWALGTARAALEEAGLKVTEARTAFPERVFHDVGALIYFLRKVPRQVPHFTVEEYDKELRLLHEQMAAGEPFRDRGVRFVIEATLP